MLRQAKTCSPLQCRHRRHGVVAPPFGLTLTRHRSTRVGQVLPGHVEQTCGVCQKQATVSLAGDMGHARCADELGVVRGGAVRQRAANVHCRRKVVQAGRYPLASSRRRLPSISCQPLQGTRSWTRLSCGVRTQVSGGGCRHKQTRSASTPLAMQLDAPAAHGTKTSRKCGSAVDFVKGAQVTANKAHMLLWRRTLECCASDLELNGATLTQFAAD